MEKQSIPLDQRLARLAVGPLARTPVTPNMLTFLGLSAGLWSGWLFAQGDAVSGYWAGMVFVFAAWMDHVDGEHARATGQVSRFGHYFDHFGAMTSYVAMFVGVGIGLRTGSLGGWAMVLGIAAGLSVAAIFSVRLWIEERHGKPAVAQSQRGGFQIEDILYVVGPVAWLDGLQPFLILAGLGAPVFLLWVTREAVAMARAGNNEIIGR